MKLWVAKDKSGWWVQNDLGQTYIVYQMKGPEDYKDAFRTGGTPSGLVSSDWRPVKIPSKEFNRFIARWLTVERISP
jgi:hypothetical protein